MKNKIKKIFISIISLFMIFTLLSTITFKTFADTENTIYIKNSVAEANESGLVVVEVVAEGQAGASVQFFYQTEGVTAIPGLDFVNVNNNIKLKIGDDGKVSYKISIKCLNTAENREKLRIYDNNNTYGRFFNLIIYKTINASLDQTRSKAKCYLPYDFKVEAVTDVVDSSDKNRAYLKEYANFQARYHKGIGDLDGKSTWYTFKKGVNVTFTDVTESWVNTYINTGFASAYGSFMINYLSDATALSLANIHTLYGGKEFMENYTRSTNCPGLSFYIQTEPCSKNWKFELRGYRLNDTAMKMIVLDHDNPYSEHGKLVDVKERTIKGETKHLYWWQKEKTWYSGSNSLMDSAFFKINPYNGILDTGIAIYNSNDELDREASGIWQFLTLVDDKAPEIVSEYVDDSHINIDGKLRFYIRFNEPVHLASHNAYLSVKINNSSNYEMADLIKNPDNTDEVLGEFTDTLVFEMDAPKTNITEITYQLPNDVICDMAYNLDKYKNVKNNVLPIEITNQDRKMNFLNGTVNLLTPTITADQTSSGTPKNIYNVLVSINDNGAKDLTDGTLYYEWSKNETKPAEEILDPSSYSNIHTFTPEENGSITLTLIKNDEFDSGTYYLHLLAVSGYGLTDSESYGEYILDGDPPTISQITPPINELKTKEYELTLRDVGSKSAKVMNITAIFKYVDDEGNTKEEKLKLIENSSKVDSLKNCITIKEDSTEKTETYKFKSTIDNSLGIPLDPIVSNILNNVERKEFDVSFYVEDTAGNRSTSNVIRVVYDKRDLFRVKVDVSLKNELEQDGYTLINDIDVSAAAYDISTATNNKNIVISVADESTAGGTNYKNLLVDGTKFSVTINGKDVIEADGTSGDDKYRVTLSGLDAGFYDIVPRISGTSSSGNVDIIAQNVQFYLTNNKKDPTENYENISKDLVLTNRVYQLEEARYYFLDQGGSKVLSYPYGATYDFELNKSEGGSSSPSFSNINEAKKYIKYMEYQDLYLVKITSSMASLLNSGTASTSYVKAPGETVIAQEGQLWIRYKKNTWTTNSTSFGWAFYYYGNGNVSDGININGLSANLTNAMNEVVNRISNEGKIVYLVEEETLNQITGAPYLSLAQIHSALEEATVTKLGISFITPAKYEGDGGIYKNTVTVLDKEYALATNMNIKISSYTRLYYKYAGEGNWSELVCEDGKSLSQLLSNQGTGFYLFREYGLNGICEYEVYYDKETPKLEVEVGKLNTILDGSSLTFSSDSFTIKNIINEVDDLAYVAIYTYPNKKLVDVLYNSDLAESTYKLSNNNYYVQVGDRSGNIITYTVLLNTSNLEIKTYENESKTSIFVKVLNRTESEIYSYLIYLNEVLIDSEFKEINNFNDPGIYRIYVEDIYGNSETNIVEFSFKSPEIEWYYLNSSDAYSKYNPDNIVNMVIYDDANSSRISNVYTSTLLKFRFVTGINDDKVKFEILDLETGDYSYTEATDTITINTLKGFRIRTWFENYPENDHTYVVRIDTEAPVVSASFIGTTFTRYCELDDEGNVIRTATFDTIDFSKYNEGDFITLDTLIYTPSANLEGSFSDNAVINGGHIVLSFSDPSKIKTYTITRNGQDLQVNLNDNGELNLNGYGSYVITVTDMLGNVKKFSFTNTKDPISNATIDGEKLFDSTKTYGSDSVQVEALYEGQSRILIKTEDSSEAYEFRYEGNTITYGRYVCVVEKYENDNNEIVESKSARYQQEEFLLEINSEKTREKTWYTAVENEKYIISVMIVDKKPIIKIECVDERIDVEFTYVVGNNVFPSYYDFSLSKEIPSIKLLTGGEEVEITEGSKYIYVSDEITIDNNIKDTIVKIEVASSETPTFGKLRTIYDTDGFKEEFKGVEDAFYEILVTNIFGNQTEYIVVKVDSFKSIVRVKYLDGSTNEFLTNENVIYSNGTISLDVYSDSVSFVVNGEAFAGIYNSNYTTLELYKQGEYNVKVVSSNGIYEDFILIIAGDNSFIYKEEWITGYNEKALLNALGYTNTLLTPIKAEGIEFIEYQYEQNDRVVLYDNITEYKKLDESVLIDSIGKDGIGTYTIFFKNKYGDSASKTIHYNNQAQLNLSRKIVDSKSFESYDLDYAIKEGFYSNYVLKFETNSTKYEFKIDGTIYQLEEPKTLEFSNASGNGSFGYNVSFLDDYGNYIEFKAELYRADVVIDTSLMEEIEISHSLYTKDNIQITFADNLKGTVSVDGNDKKEYISGTKFYKDGTYEFIVEDIAGNRNKYTIIHKSINHYELVDSSTEQPIIIGGVVNNSSVIFRPTDDSVVKSVFKDGIQLEDYNLNVFNATGHWEMIIEDSIGNKSYAGFYLINNSLVSFDYKAPFDYTIDEVWYTDTKGKRELLDMKGSSISLVENGDYAVVVVGKEATTTFNFSVNINDTPPQAKLVGVEDGGITARDVKLSGLKSGDIVEIYKDGKLISKTNVGISASAPDITTGGNYRIVITNISGAQIEYNFTRKKIANAATSVFIIIVCFASVAGLTIGLLYHTRLKNDSDK